MTGEILGNRYRLGRELGAGGMAWVYLADDLLENVKVAVKVLYPQFSRDISYVQRFVREAKLATQISSEHVVRTLNYGADRDVYYLVMENIQGQDLSALLRVRQKLPWQEALQMAAQVVLALDAANAHGIVHRDIKPQNIMITPEGLVKVLDFGIARARALPSLTQTGFVGSPYYISPEQAMGKEVDIRSDIYSLGVVLYEALSGRLPFDAPTPWSIISQHIAQEPPSLSLQDNSLPAGIQDIVNTMLAKDPDDRYQTPSELLAAIESTLRGPIEAKVTSVSAVQSRVPDRDRAYELLLSSLYERAMEATEADEWPQAANLFTQIIKVDPAYRDASTHLAYAGLQVRLAALYAAAEAAMAEGRWAEAADELTEVLGMDTGYRDAQALLAQVHEALAQAEACERLAEWYEKGFQRYQKREWAEAAHYFGRISEVDPGYQDVAHLYLAARQRARWADSILGRIVRRFAVWMQGAKGADEALNSPRSHPPEE